jgi:DeoR/GlpR family transcriptional regulator of sugar metabolism
MLANQRRQKIFELLKEDGSAKVIRLARIFKVTEITIRQDLEKLELEGLIIREHGGAFLKNMQDNVRSFIPLNKENMDKKTAIGKKAASLIENGDIIILDSGSTTTEIARQIIGKKGLTVITNALNIALLLGADTGRNVMVTGGEFKPLTLSLINYLITDPDIDPKHLAFFSENEVEVILAIA